MTSNDDQRTRRIHKYFKRPWLLLNASPEQIRDVATGYPQRQVDMLIAFVEQARAALKALDAYRQKRTAPNATAAERAVNGLLDILRTEGMYPLLAIDRDSPGTTWQFANRFHGDTPSREQIEHRETDELFWDIGFPITTAFQDIAHGRAYLCRHCGRIGPAQRSDKRYCNGACRKAAIRTRQKNRT